MSSELPCIDDLYEKLDEIPEEIRISRSLGWQNGICMTKKNFLQLAREWGLVFPPYSSFIASVEGDDIWLIGFGG